MQPHAAQVQEPAGEGILEQVTVTELWAGSLEPANRPAQESRPTFPLAWLDLVHHSTPRIMQLRPLATPTMPTRWPGCNSPRSSASAADSGSDTVAMLPRNGKVGKSRSGA